MTVSILLVGNHGPLMGWIAARLGQEPDFRVVRVVAGASEAVQVLASQSADLLLMDADQVPDCGQTIEAFRASRARLRVILVAATDGDGVLEETLKAKADGLLLKNELVATLIPGVRRVVLGGACYPRSAEDRIEIGQSGASVPERPSAL